MRFSLFFLYSIVYSISYLSLYVVSYSHCSVQYGSEWSSSSGVRQVSLEVSLPVPGSTMRPVLRPAVLPTSHRELLPRVSLGTEICDS